MIPVQELLATQGQQMDESIHLSTKRELNRHKDAPYLDFLLAKSLSWAHYAKDDDDFLSYALSYLGSSDKIDADVIKDYSLYMGPEQLSISLCNIRKFRDLVKNVVPDFKTCTISDLMAFQKKAYNILRRHYLNGTLTGIGPWLFLAPYKLHLCLERNLWKDPAIDGIILPTGKQVIRGIKNLIRNHPKAIRSVNAHDLTEEEGDLDTGYARDCLIHGESKQMALSAKSRVLHINSGLWMLGSGGLV